MGWVEAPEQFGVAPRRRESQMPQEQGPPFDRRPSDPPEYVVADGFGDLGAYDVWPAASSEAPGPATGEDIRGADANGAPAEGTGADGGYAERAVADGADAERAVADGVDADGVGVGGDGAPGPRLTPTTAALLAAVLLAVIAGSLWAASQQTSDGVPEPVVAVSAPDAEPPGTPDFTVATRGGNPPDVPLTAPRPAVATSTRADSVETGSPVASPTRDEASPVPVVSPSPSTAITRAPDPAAQAEAALARQQQEDRAAMVFDGRWVAEIASRALAGATPSGGPDAAEAILAEHRDLKARLGAGVRLLSAADQAFLRARSLL